MTPPFIVQHPEAAALSAEIAALRETLAARLADWHDLMDKAGVRVFMRDF